MSNKKFQLGDQVTWSSQAGGNVTTKAGEVVEVVPPQASPKTKVKDPGSSRNHESYVVLASYVDKNNKKRTTNYWPLVNKLEHVAPVADIVEAETVQETVEVTDISTRRSWEPEPVILKAAVPDRVPALSYDGAPLFDPEELKKGA